LIEKPPFTLRTGALWLRRATFLPGVALLVMGLWLNALAPMRRLDLAIYWLIAAAWIGLMYWGNQIRSPVIDIEEQGLRVRAGDRRLVPWAEVSLIQEKVRALELRVGTRRVMLQPSWYVTPDLVRRFVMSRVSVGASNALSPTEYKRQSQALIWSGIASAIGAFLGALLLGRACSSW
jgi:hypothetical protein